MCSSDLEMVKIIDFLEDRFSLYLIIVGGDKKYKKKIEEMVKNRRDEGRKIYIIEPLELEEIIPFTNRFDLGIATLPATTFNLKHSLPNKFFEYIQARLGVVLAKDSASEMWDVSKDYGNSIVCDSYRAKDVAGRLNRLSNLDIENLKIASDRASRELNIEHNKIELKKILKRLIGK